jgi:hypothetical protein
MPLLLRQRLSYALALPALLLLACETDAAPRAPDDPSFDDVDSAIDPIEAEDAGPRPPDPNPVPVGGGRSDAGSPSEPDGPSGGPTKDGGLAGDARAPELGAFSGVERLLVADGKSARVHVLDAPSRDYLTSFSLNGPGAIHAAASGRYGYVLETAQNQVQVISLGLPDPVATSSATLSDPSLLPTSFSGLAPSAFGAFANDVTILFAGSSELTTFDLQSLTTTTPKVSARIPSGTGTPIVLLHLGDRVIVSEYDAASGLSQLRLLDAKLEYLTRPDLRCDAPEGAAQAGQTVAVGCADGVMWWPTSATATEIVRYPSTAGVQRVHKLAASPIADSFLTLLGEQLCLVNAQEFICEDAPADVIDYAFDATGKRAMVLSRDGTLYAFDGENLDRREEIEVFAALPVPTPTAELPGLAVGRRYVYVSDPSAGSIHIVDSAAARVLDEIDVPNGFPTQVVVFRYNF